MVLPRNSPFSPKKMSPWVPKAPLGPGVRHRRTYAPCRDVHRAYVDDVCARYDVAENVEANKAGLYMGADAQKLEEPIPSRTPYARAPNPLMTETTPPCVDAWLSSSS